VKERGSRGLRLTIRLAQAQKPHGLRWFSDAAVTSSNFAVWVFKAWGRFLSSAGAKKFNISNAFRYAKAGPKG
jgi:hypothetical protein